MEPLLTTAILKMELAPTLLQGRLNCYCVLVITKLVRTIIATLRLLPQWAKLQWLQRKISFDVQFVVL